MLLNNCYFYKKKTGRFKRGCDYFDSSQIYNIKITITLYFLLYNCCLLITNFKRIVTPVPLKDKIRKRNVGHPRAEGSFPHAMGVGVHSTYQRWWKEGGEGGGGRKIIFELRLTLVFPSMCTVWIKVWKICLWCGIPDCTQLVVY